MTKKIFIYRRGVSPVISALLLVVIVTFAFSYVAVSTQSWIVGQRRENLMEIQERLVIEDIWFRVVNGERSLITVSVRNAGEVYVVLILCTVSSSGVPVNSESVGPFEVLPSNLVRFDFSCAWAPGTIYEITIKSRKGSEVTTFETA